MYIHRILNTGDSRELYLNNNFKVFLDSHLYYCDSRHYIKPYLNSFSDLLSFFTAIYREPLDKVVNVNGSGDDWRERGTKTE